jgi:NodT family efflux transporter outer membrane factor (OMF) lipoprotein
VEVANAYLGYRYCEVQVDLLKADAESRLESLRLRKIAKLNGFQPNTEVAQFGANAADGNRSLLQQQTQCERSIKGLVALTAIDEPQLRQLLVSVPDKVGKLPNPPAFQIDAVPAKALLQRPDLVAAERDVAEANANIGVEQAKRYPKLSLSGNITPTLQNINSTGYMLAQTWAIGPTISLPMFDGGKRAANVDSAKAQYEAAVSNFKSKVRTAVKEVEEALVRLDSAGKRLPEAQNAESAYHLRLQAAHTLYQAGFNSLIDVEAAKRSDLNASLAAKDIEQEQVSAWIALYRAVGGSWDSEAERQLNGTAVAQPENPKEPVQPQEIDQSSKGKS